MLNEVVRTADLRDTVMKLNASDSLELLRDTSDWSKNQRPALRKGVRKIVAQAKQDIRNGERKAFKSELWHLMKTVAIAID